jgi:hypothetical protein
MTGDSYGCNIYCDSSLNIGTISGGTVSMLATGSGGVGCYIYDSSGSLNVLQNFGELSFSSLDNSGILSVCNQSAVFYQDSSDVNNEKLLDSQESGDLTISPEKYKYEEQFDGTYKIMLKLANVKIDLPDPVSIRLPQMSRVVDFSKDDNGRPRYIGDICYGKTENDIWSAGAEYKGTYGYWMAKDSGDSSRLGMSLFNRVYNKDVAGDYYLLIEHMDGTIPFMSLFCKESETYNFTGLHRKFLPFDKFSDAGYVDFNIGENVSASTVKYIMAGFTLPVNRVLYQGYNGSGTKHAWQINEDGDVVRTASTACRTVTTDACAKLKADYGDDLIVYVVKYKKQGVDTDYAYLDSCATAANFVYDAASDDALSDVLQRIANDIKVKAGYKPAENK